MTRIIQLSDIHFGGEHPAALAAVATYIRNTAFDLLLVTGDITALGKTLEFQSAKAWFDTLPGPKLFMPGNHDTPWAGIVDRIVSPFGRYSAYFGDSRSDAFASPELNVQALNTARGIQPRANWSKGQIAPYQVKRAINGLDNGGAEPGAARIVACHHPLIEVLGGPITGRVWGGARAAAAFCAARVDAILTGHLHTPFAVPLPFGDRRTYAIGCGTLSLRERGFPPSFNVIELERGCIRVAAHAFKGSHLQAERTWALDRRAA